jgi:hypothetical protein
MRHIFLLLSIFSAACFALAALAAASQRRLK